MSLSGSEVEILLSKIEIYLWQPFWFLLLNYFSKVPSWHLIVYHSGPANLVLDTIIRSLSGSEVAILSKREISCLHMASILNFAHKIISSRVPWWHPIDSHSGPEILLLDTKIRTQKWFRSEDIVQNRNFLLYIAAILHFVH